MLKKVVILFSFFGLLASELNAQDIHFSEFFITPLFVNPALTGNFEGTYRYSGIIRRQWSSVTAQPFQTFGGAAEMTQPLNLKPMSAGIRIFHDYAGLSNLTTTSIAVPVSLKLRFGSEKNITLSLGGQAEFFQRSIDYSRLSYDDQFFDNRYFPDIPSQESSRVGTVTNFNFSGGLYLEKRVSERKRLGLGISSFNLNQPDLSWSSSAASKVPTRTNFHVFSSIALGASDFDLMPAAQFQIQGVHNELLLGSALRYHLLSTALDQRSIQFGLWARTRDAVFLSAGFSKNNLFVGGSYDFNFSRLRVASENLGGWEIGIIYTIATVREKVQRVRQCPDYL